MSWLLAIILSLIIFIIVVFSTSLLYILYSDKIDEIWDNYIDFIESLARKIRKEN